MHHLIFLSLLFFLPSCSSTVSQAGYDSIVVEEHVNFVKKKFDLELLAEGNNFSQNVFFDLEFISYEFHDLPHSRFLILACIEDLLVRAKKENQEITIEDIRYGISFLEKNGDIREEGIARVAILKPKRSSSSKIFFSILKSKESGRLLNYQVENY